MNSSEAFLEQARSDFNVFKLLWEVGTSEFPACHALQHFQMAAEKMSKSILLNLDPENGSLLTSHVAFRQIVPILQRRHVGRNLGYQNARQFKAIIELNRRWIDEVERLSPSIGTQVAGDAPLGSNVEYPWEQRTIGGKHEWVAPVKYEFTVATYLRTHNGLNFIDFIDALLDRLPSVIHPKT